MINDTDHPSQLARLQDENKRLRKANSRLTAFNRIASAVCEAHSLEQILDHIVQDCVSSIGTEQGVIMLPTNKTPFIRSAGNTGKRLKPELLSKIVPALEAWTTTNREPLLANNVKQHDQLKGHIPPECDCHSLLSVPLTLSNDRVGFIALFNKKKNSGGFTDEDRDMLHNVAAQSTQAIEKFRLLDQETRLLKIKEDLAVARHIHASLFPVRAPDLEGYEVYGRTVQARDVGGDYFDFIPSDDNRSIICVADISGKGLPAALLMANLQATVRSQTLMRCAKRNCHNSAHRTTACFVDNCMERINTLLCNSTTSEKYATMFYSVLDTANHELTYTNAGHSHPILFRGTGECEIMNETGLPIGMFDDARHQSRQVNLEPGDTLVICSDGVTESLAGEGEEYGTERLIEFVKSHRHLSPHLLTDALLQDLTAFVGPTKQQDDITVVILQRT